MINVYETRARYLLNNGVLADFSFDIVVVSEEMDNLEIILYVIISDYNTEDEYIVNKILTYNEFKKIGALCEDFVRDGKPRVGKIVYP